MGTMCIYNWQNSGYRMATSWFRAQPDMSIPSPTHHTPTDLPETENRKADDEIKIRHWILSSEKPIMWV